MSASLFFVLCSISLIEGNTVEVKYNITSHAHRDSAQVEFDGMPKLNLMDSGPSLVSSLCATSLDSNGKVVPYQGNLKPLAVRGGGGVGTIPSLVSPPWDPPDMHCTN